MSLHHADVSRERAALMRAQRRKIDLQTASMRASLVPRAEAAEIWARLVGNARARLLGMPSKLAGRLVGLSDPAVIRELVEAEIHEALAELSSEGNLEQLTGGLRQTGAEDVDAAAETDGERVGRRKPKAKPGGKRGAGPMADQPGRVSARRNGRRQRPDGAGGGGDERGADREDGDPE